MKPLFDKTDKIEKFQKAINYEAKLLCNVDEAFTREKAADLLQRLVRSWQMDEYDVTMTTIQSVQDTIDKRLRGYVLRFMDLEKSHTLSRRSNEDGRYFPTQKMKWWME